MGNHGSTMALEIPPGCSPAVAAFGVLNPCAFASAADAIADGVLLIAGVEVRDVAWKKPAELVPKWWFFSMKNGEKWWVNHEKWWF